MCLFSFMFIVVGVFRFVSYSYVFSMCAAIGVYLVTSTCCLRFSRSDNISFSSLELVSFISWDMGRNNINFNLLSLNARGLRTFDRRKAFFNWLAKSSADICFLQETYSTSEVENIWKKQWKGDMFFSHGTGHSKGVLILVRDHLDFKLQSVKVDSQGRYILLEATIQDSPFLLLNIYAPNKCSEQCDFFETISEVLKSSFTISDYSVIIGGDSNVIFDQELDESGGLKKTKDNVKVLEDICLEHDLLDIWRVRHPKEKRFTWRQKAPIIQRRLDF